MPGRKMSVAIVDDDQSVRKALARLLTANFFETDTYGSAQEFIDSLSLKRPECLVLDLHMPDFGGLELQHHLRRNGIKIPTVIITAHNEIGLRERCVNAGAVAFLVKPLTENVLVESINSVTQGAGAPKDKGLGS